MTMTYRLARLAVSRASLRAAISTARACGDSEYVERNRPHLDIFDKRIESLVKVLNPKVVKEAREITNAPI